MKLFVVALAAVAALYAFGPREAVDLTPRFDAALIGDDPAAYLARREAVFTDIRPGAEKRIQWFGTPGTRTEVALVYLHGFSATSEEIRPVPDRVAGALGANIVFTRLAGHGRTGAAMAGPSVADWVFDLDEALAIADRIGERTIVMATSTGASLAVAAMAEGRLTGIDGIVMISPNFRIRNPAAAVLTLPAARYWAPPIFGESRSFETQNEAHARWWTTSYPTLALFPMAALVQAASAADHTALTTPALFLFADSDQVVDAAATRDVAEAWGGPVQIAAIQPGPDDDPYHHFIAGDILSPGQTDTVARIIADWAGRL